MPSICALATTGQLEETAIFEWALYFASTIQSTQKYFKLAPRLAIGYYGKDFHLIILQLEWLDDIARIHGRKHGEDDRFFQAFPKDIMSKVVNRNVTNHKTADIGERLKVLKGDSGIETHKIQYIGF